MLYAAIDIHKRTHLRPSYHHGTSPVVLELWRTCPLRDPR